MGTLKWPLPASGRRGAPGASADARQCSNSSAFANRKTRQSQGDSLYLCMSGQAGTGVKGPRRFQVPVMGHKKDSTSLARRAAHGAQHFAHVGGGLSKRCRKPRTAQGSSKQHRHPQFSYGGVALNCQPNVEVSAIDSPNWYRHCTYSKVRIK